MTGVPLIFIGNDSLQMIGALFTQMRYIMQRNPFSWHSVTSRSIWYLLHFRRPILQTNMNEDSIELFDIFFSDDDFDTRWKDSVERQSTRQTAFEDEDERDIRNLFEGVNAEVENDDEETSTDESDCESQRDATEISDEEIINLRLKELNRRLRNIPFEEAAKIRKRRRNLKNRTYALNCRLKKRRVHEDLINENTQLKKQVEDGKCKLLEILNEKEEYKKKYKETRQALIAFTHKKRH